VAALETVAAMAKGVVATGTVAARAVAAKAKAAKAVAVGAVAAGAVAADAVAAEAAGWSVTSPGSKSSLVKISGLNGEIPVKKTNSFKLKFC